MSLEEKIYKICEELASDLLNEYDKDKAMILNNLGEYVLPKRQRTPIVTTVSQDRNYKITYEYIEADNSHPGTPGVDEQSKEV